ncbi:MAG: acylphosphatase [Gemmatimonadota bacterium]
MSDRRAYRVTGSVQGVGFRWWARTTASGLNLRGTVRNARDGAVEVEAAGDPDALDRFEEELARGPGSAHVREVRREEPGEDALPAGFEIVR